MINAPHDESPISQELAEAVDALLPSRRQDGTFLPGSTGNPHGRPRKGQSFKEIAENLPDRLKRAIIIKQADKAIREGSTAAAEFVADRAEGKPGVIVEVQDSSYDDEVFAKVLKALADAGQLSITEAVDGEYREVDTADFGRGGYLDAEILRWNRDAPLKPPLDTNTGLPR